MMRRFFAFFVDNSMMVNLVTVAVIVFGAITMLDIPRTLMPAIGWRSVNIEAEWPGASAVDVERLVTFRLEEALQDLEGLDEIESKTVNGATTVQLSFASGHQDMNGSVEQAKSRVEGLSHILPRELRPIRVVPQRADRMPGPAIVVRGGLDENPDHRQATQLLVDRLRRVPGVVEVGSSLRRQDLHIQFDAPRLAGAGIDVTSARARIESFLRLQPIGEVEVLDQSIGIEMNQGAADIAALEKLPLVVNRDGQGIRLGRVADIELQFEETSTLDLLDGERYISINVQLAPDADVIRVADRTDEIVAEFELFPDGLKPETGADPSELIEHELEILQSNAIAGLGIVLVILLVFLGWRIATMTALGLPFCYMGGVLVMDWAGQTFNLISLFSLILVLGILVDDAIIVAEAFAKRMEEGKSSRDAAIDAATDMFRPVVGMMVTTALAFAPLLMFAEGNAEPLKALPIAVLALLAFSFVESFLVLPNHLHHFMPRAHKAKERRLTTLSKAAYRRVLSWLVKARYLTVPLFIATLAFSFWLVTNKMEIKSNKSIGAGVLVHAELAESNTLDETAAAIRPIEEALLAMRGDDVDSVQTELGASRVNGRRVEGFRFAKLEVTPPGSMADQEKHFDAIEEALAPLIEAEQGNFEQLYIIKTGGEPGQDSVSVFVSGSDRIDFHEIEQRIGEVVVDIEGVHEVYVDPTRLQQTWQFKPNHRQVLSYDMTTDGVAAQLREHVPGPYIDRVRLAGEELLIYTHFGEDLVPQSTPLNSIMVMTPKGISIPLGVLGRWEEVETLRKIEHKDLLRVFELDVVYDPEATNSDDVTAGIEEALAPLRADWPGFHISVEPPKAEAEFRSWALKISVIVCGLIYVALALSLNSLLEPVLVMLAIPFGISGVIFALYAHGMDFEVMAFVGIMGLIGVVVNDSLVVLDTVRRTHEEEPEKPFREALLDGSTSRFQAVVLTSLTTLGGVFPLAYGLMGDAGWIQPMVFALGWGLLFATLLTLVLLPSALQVIEDFRSVGRWLLSKVKRSPAGAPPPSEA